MRMILIGSALALGSILAALSPLGFLIAPLDQWIWRHVTLASYLLLTALSPGVEWLARAAGSTAAYAALGVLGAAGLTLATAAGLRLAAVDIAPAARAFYMFLLVWSLGIPLIVLVAMEQWMCIA